MELGPGLVKPPVVRNIDKKHDGTYIKEVVAPVWAASIRAAEIEGEVSELAYQEDCRCWTREGIGDGVSVDRELA